jgi:predicted Zn-dependent protease
VLAARAEAEAGLGEGDAAEARVLRALARASGDGTANYVLGLLRLRQGRFAEAREALEKAAVAFPDSPVVQEKLAAACEGSKDALGARKHRDLAGQREKEREARVKEARRIIGYTTSEGKEP